MKTLCLFGGDNTSRCASEAAFDLQLFSASQALVHTVEGKVTLDFTRLGAMASYDVVDEAGRKYGTGYSLNVTLVSPPEGASPIEDVVHSATAMSNVPTVIIFNSKYLGETVTCKVIGWDSDALEASIWLCYGEAWNSDKKVFVSVAPGQEAEATYRHNAAGDCWAESFRNGEIVCQYGAYAVLSNGTRVTSLSTGVCHLTADSEGDVTVGGEVSLGSSVFHLTQAALCEDSSSEAPFAILERYAYGNENPVAAEYDTETRTFSSIRGQILLLVDREADKYCIYRFNEDDCMVDIYERTDFGNGTETLVTRRAYHDLSKVSLQVPEDVSLVLAEDDFGLELDMVTVTMEGTALAPQGEDLPEGKAGTVYQDKTGNTRYAVLTKSGGVYTLTAGDSAITKIDLTGLGAATVKIEGAKLGASTTYTTGSGSFTTGDKDFTLSRNGEETILSDADSVTLLQAGKYRLTTETAVTVAAQGTHIINGTSYALSENAGIRVDGNGKATKLTAGTLVLDANESIAMNRGTSVTIGSASYTAATDGTSLANEGGKATLTEGAVALDKDESVTIGTTEYTAAANGTSIDYNGGKGKLTAGTVALDANPIP